MDIFVNLHERSYPITVERTISERIPSILKQSFPHSKFVLVTNPLIESLYSASLSTWKSALDLKIYTMPDGEQYKTIDTWKGILDFLIHEKFERSSVLIALGGGVIGDVAGFAASAFLRGIPFIQIPTTLLSMVDSSVGGKTAVDHPDGKNLIGAFYQPKKVFVDIQFLDTLPENQFLSGCAELFKYGFIGGCDMFDFVNANIEKILSRDKTALIDGIVKSIEIKANVVSQDEFETKGLRATLNYGHTFAHSLERYFDFNGILHGEAVMWGMHCAFSLAKCAGTIRTEDMPVYENIMKRIPLPVLPSQPQAQILYDMMFTDKKVNCGKVRFIVPATPGTSIVKSDICSDAVLCALNEVLSSGYKYRS